MSGFPGILKDGRRRRVVFVAMLASCQAACVGVAAIATRDTFSAFSIGSAELPIYSLFLIASSGIGIALFRWSERVVAEGLGQDYAAAVRIRLFEHISRLPQSELVHRRTGGMSLRFVGDLSAVRNWISQGVTRLLSAAIVMPIVGLMLFHINKSLALAALVPLVLGLGFIAAMGPVLLSAHGSLRQKRAQLAADATERIKHMAELRLLGRFGREKKQIKKSNQIMISASLHRRRWSSILRVVPDITSGLAVALVLGVALNGSISGADAAGTLAAMGMLTQTLRELGSVWDRYCAWRAAYIRCMALLEVRPMPKAATLSQGQRAPVVGTQIRLSRISHRGLRQINVDIEAGQKIGITGPNGSGKSTLIKLIAGMERQSRGSIMLDQLSHMKWTRTLNKRIVYVGSGSPILRGSLRKALTMGAHPRPDDAKIESVARHFGLEHVLTRLDGLDGRIAENGGNLSSGEIRRVLLTRAALTPADLLLLDDLDQTLDDSGIRLVDELIHKNDATVLVVSRNDQLLSAMDTIWTLEDGELIEQNQVAVAKKFAAAG